MGKVGVRWSKPVCPTLSQLGPTSPSRAATTTPAKDLDADLFFCDILANLRLHLRHRVNLERVAETGDP
jgi:hypothetical protein